VIFPLHVLCPANSARAQASGRLGPYILRAVQADPAFNVTVITRESSKATFPDGTTVVRVGDDYPEEQMEKTFQGQDAVVLSLSYAGEHHRSALTEAAIRAGVRRVVASGYGANDENEEAQRVFPISANKAAMVQELRSLEQDGWSWTSICCGLFFDLYVQSPSPPEDAAGAASLALGLCL
jgi:putative NADH-flavin reductase